MQEGAPSSQPSSLLCIAGNDPRAAKIACPPDPRIHFALVCGAKSCPPIKLYTPDNLEEGLAAAGGCHYLTRIDFCEGGALRRREGAGWSGGGTGCFW